MTETFEKVRSILSSQLDIEESKIEESTHIADDLGADSLDVVELMMAVEEEFGITIEDEAAKTFALVEDVVRYIDDKDRA